MKNAVLRHPLAGPSSDAKDVGSGQAWMRGCSYRDASLERTVQRTCWEGRLADFQGVSMNGVHSLHVHTNVHTDRQT